MPSSRFDGTVEVHAGQSDSWAAVTDIAKVTTWIGIISDVVEVRPLDYYEAVLSDRVGPFKLRADVRVTVTDVVEGERLRIRIEGEDRAVASRISAQALVVVKPGEAGTEVRLEGEYEVAGKVAAMGSSTIRKKADRIISDFFNGMAAELGTDAT